MKRRPELRILPGSKLEVPRQHSHDRVWKTAERHRLAYYALSSAKPFLPCGVAQHGHPGRLRQVLACMKVAPQYRCDAKRAEKTIAYADTVHWLCTCRSSEQVAGFVVDIHRAKDLIEFLPVEIVEIRKVGARHHRDTFSYLNQPRGIRVGQRLDQCGVDKAKDGNASAYPQCQYQNGRTSEAWTLAQLAQRVTKILE